VKTAAAIGDDHRWVAEVMGQVVFADPSNKAARELEADALEQLGYQTENPTWRNEFLMGAFELRHGIPNIPIPGTATPDVVQAMTTDMLLDYMGIRLNSEKADGVVLNINWKQPDTGETYAIEVQNSVLIYTKDKQLHSADATLTMTRSQFAYVLMGGSTLDKELGAGSVKIEGSTDKVTTLFGMLDTFQPMFPIVTP
jgi:linear primary-alkylsulfatase